MNKANYHAKYRALIFKNIINWSDTSHPPKGAALGLRNASCIFVSEMKTFSWKRGMHPMHGILMGCHEHPWALLSSLHDQKHINTVIYSFYTIQLYAVVLHTTQLRQIQRERNNHPCLHPLQSWTHKCIPFCVAPRRLGCPPCDETCFTHDCITLAHCKWKKPRN